MLAKDVMTTAVLTVTPETDVGEIAGLMLDSHISAVPVIDADGSLVGIVSEGDLIHRAESETRRRPSWWLRLLATPEEPAERYLREFGRRARDVMTKNVISVTPDTPLTEIAAMLEKYHIKRVTVLEGRQAGRYRQPRQPAARRRQLAPAGRRPRRGLGPCARCCWRP
jgi:CBS domain-containing protein